MTLRQVIFALLVFIGGYYAARWVVHSEKIMKWMDAERPMAAHSDGPSAVPAEVLQPCPHEADQAVLRKMLDSFGVGPPTNAKDIDRRIEDLHCVRDWANGLKDECIKDAYLKWEEVWEKDAEKAKKELLETGNVRSDTDKEEAERQAQYRKQRAYEASHVVPKPPSCSVDVIRKVK